MASSSRISYSASISSVSAAAAATQAALSTSRSVTSRIDAGPTALARMPRRVDVRGAFVRKTPLFSRQHGNTEVHYSGKMVIRRDCGRGNAKERA